ncbi:EAL domain-containing protein [Propionivibrio limicola]|uniref:EAL domain-containing protein n=1 Tax=Propionivibrio limicola TaxID=167645 RepID=UPI0014795EEC|nr:EAL domain-containing protein [Propionivibrio limicola]
MAFSRQSFFRRHFRTLLLVGVGVLGVSSTAWVWREMAGRERDRLEQLFRREAQERGELIVRAYEAPQEQLLSLQRLYHSVGDVDWRVFTKFAETIPEQVGVAGVSWAPRVEADERAAFERSSQMLWGRDYVIRELDEEGRLVASRPQAVYFPLFYQLPEEHRALAGGFDLHAFANRQALIERAIDSGQVVSNPVGPSIISLWRNGKLVVMMAPVYRSGAIPLLREERRIAAHGVLALAIDIGELFDHANAMSLPSGLVARLYDQADPEQVVHSAGASGDADREPLVESDLSYQRPFDLAGRQWIVRIDAGPAWRTANGAGSLLYVPVIGGLLTLWLLLYLRRLVGRSELVDTLSASNAQARDEQRRAELWAKKLSLLVEQNPATILITDLDGRVEYVNDKFVETTGYTREEAIGQDSRVLNPGSGDESEKPVYRALWAALEAGKSWEGELQNRRRDGSLYWERVFVSAIKEHDGTPICFVAIKEDITELRAVMQLLRESEGRFRAAMSVMIEGFAILSPEGRFIFANRAAEEILGRAGLGLQGLSPAEIELERVNPDGTLCPAGNSPAIRALREQREVRDALLGYRSEAGGSVRWVQVNAAPLRVGDGARQGVVMTLVDITERRRDEEQLKLAFEAIRHSGEGILMTDAEQRIISVNPAFEILTGYAAAEIIGQTPPMITSQQHDESFFVAMQDVLRRTGHWQGEISSRRKGGEVFPVWLGVSVVREADGRPKYQVYIFSDMTERQAAQQRIEFLAHHDPLTELPNRLLLRDRAELGMAHAHRMSGRMALLFLDLDRFKTINDSLGHPVGDALLKAVVERLKSCVRETDTISRQGGDEFIIVLNDVRDGDAVSRVADKIHQYMAEPFLIGEHSLMTSFSIGIALYPDDGDDFDGLLQKADTAMYHAKEAGRNSHRFFTEEMNLKVVEHLTLENQLRRALDNGEFVLHYQPQFDLAEERIVGVEALIRWNCPEKGLVPPGRFIPVAEDSGLIVPIGAWVLGEACRQARAWQDAGLPPFTVAVNLSAIQFRRPDLINNVINALVLSDLDAQWLELELTESILIQDAETTLDTVRRLKALGIKLSVDDFGTGYSSLTYLKRFAVDKLKIDQSFVRELVSDPDDAAIVRAIIQMAHSLKLKTIAEGVESRELADLLRLFHCDEAQGYLFARPMPADELEAFVRARLEPPRHPLA